MDVYRVLPAYLSAITAGMHRTVDSISFDMLRLICHAAHEFYVHACV
jgi:hypothetical protein